MDKAKIMRLCDDVEKSLPNLCLTIFYRERDELIEKLKAITAEITAPPKSNADRIRQMTDEELADWITDGHNLCDLCQFSTCRPGFVCEEGVLEWLKQEVSEDAGTD